MVAEDGGVFFMPTIVPADSAIRYHGTVTTPRVV